ncbi:MAG: S46 family peptidase [Phycisphaerales bacterium]
MKQLITILSAIACLVVLAPSPSRADEGMWLFEKPPVDQMRRSLGFRPTAEWLEHVRKASLRFDVGGSGSFVGPNGLAITNHHVIDGALVRMSTPERDILRDGYLARSPEQELPMPDFEVRALWEIEDVTQRVKAAGEGKDAADAEQARRAEIASIESEANERTGLDCNVVTLYNGATYHLYCYKTWDDVRLVWAPELAIAGFGGDVDNFRYPRYCLDAAIVRVYEDNKPYTPEHFFEFTEEGVEPMQPTFVSGHPGSTRRLLSVNHLGFLRDREWPMQLNYTYRRQVELEGFAEEFPEHADLIRRDLPGITNWRKALDDRLRALQTGRVQARKDRQEAVFRARVGADPSLAPGVERAYETIGRSLEAMDDLHLKMFVLDRVGGNRSELYGIARRLVRRAHELEKPSGERLPEYADARLPDTERRIMSEAPIEPALEIHRLETWLGLFAETWGATDPLVMIVTGPDGAKVGARALVEGTRLADPAFREELMAMDLEELRRVDDIMLRFAFALEPAARELIDRYDNEVVAPQREAYDTIAAARFAVFGENDYPDATFTLRLSFGRVQGYEGAGGTVPHATIADGLWRRWSNRNGEPPFDLSQRWIDARDAIDPRTPVNFISDHHIIGGNSGSPVIDARARFVGVIFDGNEHSASWGSIYSKARGRAVSVDARFIATALRDVYDAEFLIDELYAD